MAEIQTIQKNSGIECLRKIFKEFRRNINFDALLTKELYEKFNGNESEIIIELSNAHDLRPEKHSDLAEIAL